MRMYVANCTLQNQDFQYITQIGQRARQQMIPALGQIVLSGELNANEIDYIAEQHAIYGMVKVDEIDRTKPFVGLCWDTQRILENKIRYGHMHNQEVKNQQGVELRREAAVAINNALEGDQMNQSSGLKAMELTLVEEPNKDGKDIEVNERIRVDANAADGIDTQGRKGGRK